MGLTNMVMKPANFKNSSIDEDIKEGTDGWIDNLRVAKRRRNIPSSTYGQISIRYSVPSGCITEYHKLLNGDFKAQLYDFEFTDVHIICNVADIVCILRTGHYEVRTNPDKTQGCYIDIDDIVHLTILKEE